jgi:hypothetical protein
LLLFSFLTHIEIEFIEDKNFMEPTTTLAASTIAGLAFNEFIKSGAGEIAKKS